MKNTCDRCYDPIRRDAYICVHECTFCENCTKESAFICPNCRGELVKRPTPSNSTTSIISTNMEGV